MSMKLSASRDPTDCPLIFTDFGKNAFVVKAGPGVLYGLSGVSTTAGFIMLFDRASAPTNGAPPRIAALPTTANQPWFIDPGLLGIGFPTGIVAMVSSTRAALTIGAADTDLTARYV